MTPPLDERVDQLLVDLFRNAALQVDSVYTAEGDPDAVRMAVDVLRVQGYTRIETDGRRITVRT